MVDQVTLEDTPLEEKGRGLLLLMSPHISPEPGKKALTAGAIETMTMRIIMGTRE